MLLSGVDTSQRIGTSGSSSSVSSSRRSSRATSLAFDSGTSHRSGAASTDRLRGGGGGRRPEAMVEAASTAGTEAVGGARRMGESPQHVSFEWIKEERWIWAATRKDVVG